MCDLDPEVVLAPSAPIPSCHPQTLNSSRPTLESFPVPLPRFEAKGRVGEALNLRCAKHPDEDALFLSGMSRIGRWSQAASWFPSVSGLCGSFVLFGAHPSYRFCTAPKR